MVVSLNWDMRNINGIIVNERYKNGVLFSGSALKPKLQGINYSQFLYQEARNIYKIALVGDTGYRNMTDTEKSVVREVAVSWVQEEGQEGNPNPDQLALLKVGQLKTEYKLSAAEGKDLVDEYEPISWEKQEREARAFLLDEEAFTPTLDALLLGRAIVGETKIKYVNSIITKADIYTSHLRNLGKLQGLLKRVELARFNQDKSELASINW